MNGKVIVRPEAERELADAFAWYEERRAGLGADLVAAVEAVLTRVGQSPESFPRVHKDVRRAVLKRFPYAVFFVLGRQVSVIAIFHARRDPEIWQQRAGG